MPQRFQVFYREAGPADAPKLLLHGFPSAGHMFRDLIPLLADRFLMVAPDLSSWSPWSELHDAELVVRRIVDVEREANLVDIEPQRSIDIPHRQYDNLD